MVSKPQFVLSFDGSDDYISTQLDVQPSAMPNTTWEAWVKPIRPTHPQQGYQMIFSIDDGGWDRFIAVNEGEYRIGHGNGYWAPTKADIGQWQHIALVYTAEGQIKFYKNGSESVYSEKAVGQASRFRLDIARSPGSAYYFQGKLTELRIWNTVRTTAEINANMRRRLLGTEPGLVGYWPLNEGSGTTAQDKTAHGNQGAIAGAMWEQAEPDFPLEDQKTLRATGLEDFGYWYRWKQNLPKISSGNKPFRRGRIWT